MERKRDESKSHGISSSADTTKRKTSMKRDDSLHQQYPATAGHQENLGHPTEASANVVEKRVDPEDDVDNSHDLKDYINLLTIRKRLEEASADQGSYANYDDYELTTKDYSADWSDYDSWGFDGLMKKRGGGGESKRGLGSMLS